ncbi:MAG: formylglycine-generating enzyme family protein, partial [Anaerolineae bacterium]|nr:formylglycine-generating enzyme family protein [Anaerolineae bacterium]
GSTFSGSNLDWQAFYPDGFQHTFDDGVPMVLVPAGRFMMGSNDGDSDERPVHEQLIDEPFWIDLTEVTQADFERLLGTEANPSYFDGDQRPVESITWFEARDFCALRGARLPTEREWEYAARGPAGWDYPWWDSRKTSNAVWGRSSDQGTANVRSISAGRSWVGAYDLSGNVWEWVSSLYLPYDSAEDREADTGNRTDILRVLRGGSFASSERNLRSANRGRPVPGFDVINFGFRCARSS